MSNTTEVGQTIEQDSQLWDVVRVVECTSLFTDEEGSYILHERYVELRNQTTREVGFKILSETKNAADHLTTKGLDPRVWRKF